MKNKKEIKLIEYQIIFSAISILAALISIFLLYNEKLHLEDKNNFLTGKQSKKIIIFNRTIFLIIALGFLYINYLSKDIAEKNDNLSSYRLQIYASIFNVIGAIIVLYVAFTNTVTEEISDIQNPII